MRPHADPPLDHWQPSRPPTGRPVIATGHQAWLWHPGILAKDLAMVAAAAAHDADTLHLVVDHDVHEALTLQLPIIEGDALRIETLRLASMDAPGGDEQIASPGATGGSPASARRDASRHWRTSRQWHPDRSSIPTGAQPPVDAATVIHTLEQARAPRWGGHLARRRPDEPGTPAAHLPVDLQPLITAWTDLPRCESLAQQITQVLARLRSPLVGRLPLLYSTHLCRDAAFQAQVDMMLHDASRCVTAYNQAVVASPEAGMWSLGVERERIELPLWWVRWGQPRGRVYADVADSTPLLVDDQGRPVDAASTDIHHGLLAPRALLLTAYLRRHGCNFFIHGKGGGVYDRVMEQWWDSWMQSRGEDARLAPMAVVSADVHLPFDAPVADGAALERAVWYRHHLPHNVDRELGLDGEQVRRKRELLATMDADRDRPRRRAAFREIHRINDELAAAHGEALAAADEELARTRQGVANQAIAEKRDWCFALYPPASLAALKETFTGRG